MKKKTRPIKQSRFSGTGVVVRLPLAQRNYIKRLVEQSDGLKSQSDVMREIVRYYITHHPEPEPLPDPGTK
jgi:hypothetical protein